MDLSRIRQFGLERCRKNLATREQLIQWLQAERERINGVIKVRHRDPSALFLIPFLRSDTARQGWAGAMGHAKAQRGDKDAAAADWQQSPHYQWSRFLDVAIDRLRGGMSSMPELCAFAACFNQGSEVPELEPAFRTALETGDPRKIRAFVNSLHRTMREVINDGPFLPNLEKMGFTRRFREMFFLERIDQQSTVALYRAWIFSVLFGA